MKGGAGPLFSQPAEPAAPRPLSVAELNREVKRILEGGFPFVAVRGELSNLKVAGSGHVYFTLKDAESQIGAVLWRGDAARVRFELRDGLSVVARGKLAVYEPRGTYQIVCSALEPAGLGALQLAFEQLKRKLHAEGLFDEARKRPLPFRPRRVGVVTSPSGAAVRDVIKTIAARDPSISVLVAPVRVQGAGAAEEIAAAIALLNRLRAADVLVVGRGGGSVEDLWAFNEEVVARAIAASEIPVVSAVGHEIDWTIADFVADARAKTPTHAGVLVAPERERLLAAADDLARRLDRALDERIARCGDALRSLEARLRALRPLERIRTLARRQGEIAARLGGALRLALARARSRESNVRARLEALSPLRVLDRGYSLTSREGEGAFLVDTAALSPGERIVTRLRRGRVVSRVEEIGPE